MAHHRQATYPYWPSRQKRSPRCFVLHEGFHWSSRSWPYQRLVELNTSFIMSSSPLEGTFFLSHTAWYAERLQPGTEHVSPALKVGILTTGPPGKSRKGLFYIKYALALLVSRAHA